MDKFELQSRIETEKTVRHVRYFFDMNPDEELELKQKISEFNGLVRVFIHPNFLEYYASAQTQTETPNVEQLQKLLTVYHLYSRINHDAWTLCSSKKPYLERRYKMPDMTMARKIVVFRHIEDLPADEKGRAQKLYAILDKIEFLTFAPLYFGMFAMIVLPFLAAFLGVKLPAGSEGMKLLYVFGGITLFYAAGVVITLKKLVFNPRRNGAVEQARTMLSSDDNYRSTLETLIRLDPPITRIIKKHITQAV